MLIAKIISVTKKVIKYAYEMSLKIVFDTMKCPFQAISVLNTSKMS